MRYWWVNHGGTAAHALKSGLLWAPKQEKHGARSQFYENLTFAMPGDFVLSMAGGLLTHLGLVKAQARESPMPADYPPGSSWGADGWLLEVAWRPLVLSLKPKWIIEALGPLLPAKYSPVHPKSGKGNQKAYFAEIGAEAFSLVVREASESDLIARGGLVGLTGAEIVGVSEPLHRPPLTPRDARPYSEVLRDSINSFDRLIAETEALPDFGMIGHNRPPASSDDGTIAVPPSDLQLLVATANSVREILASKFLDKDSIHRHATTLADLLLSAGRWTAKKADLAADEFAKKFGAWMAPVAAGVIGVSLVSGIHPLVARLADAVQDLQALLTHLPLN